MLYIITTESFPNGMAATQRIKCYAKAVVANGEECTVLVVNRLEDRNSPLGNESVAGEMDGYKFRYVGGDTYCGKNRIQNLYFRIKDTLLLLLFILVKCSNNDSILFYSYSSILMNLLLFVAKMKKVKIYCEFCEHPRFQFVSYYKNGKDNSLKLFKKLKSFDGILVISSQLKHLFVENGIDESKLHLVNMAVDAERFSSLQKQKKDEYYYISYCGAADNNKDGVDKLLESFSIVSKKHPLCRLRIIGPIKNNKACNGNIELAKKLGIDDKVDFMGIVSYTKLPQVLKDSDLLVLARPNNLQAQYGFPTKLGEYLLTKNPVVVTDVGDISRFLTDGVNAYIAKDNSPEEFSKKILEAVADPFKSKKVGELGYEVAITEFSQTAISRALGFMHNLKVK